MVNQTEASVPIEIKASVESSTVNNIGTVIPKSKERDTSDSDSTSQPTGKKRARKLRKRERYAAKKTIKVSTVGAQSWRVAVQIENYEVNLLVDTGAMVTILRPDVFKSMGGTTRYKLEESSLNLRHAGGDRLGVLGQCSMPFIMGGESCECDVVVAEIATRGILGMNFLERYGVTLNMKAGTMEFPGGTVVCLNREKRGSNLNLYTVSRVTIPPRSECLVPVRLKPKTAGYTGVLEANRKFCEKYGLVPGRAVVNTSRDKIPMLVTNMSEVPIKINRGQLAGRCLAVKSFKPSDLEKKTDGEILAVIEDEDTGAEDDLPSELQTLLEKTALEGKERARVKQLLLRNIECFKLEGDVAGHTSLVKHSINTGTHPPIRQRMRRMPEQAQEKVEKELESMLKENVIEPSDSPWASPIVLVTKKDGSTRFCVDFRKLNEITHKDAYPLPNIEDTFDSLAGSSYFSALDLASGFWQVEMSGQDKEKTAFTTRQGLYQFKVMPFGLCNAPATFERLIESIFRGMLWTRCLVYVDDIICYGKTFDQAYEALEEALKRLKGAGLKLKPRKCELFKKELLYLGFIVDGAGVRCDPEKIATVKDWEQPRNLTEVRSFLGFAGYHRRFIKEYAEVAKPLSVLARKDEPFRWHGEQQVAFEELKTALCEAPVLGHPTPTGAFILDTDASAYGLGGVLSQIQEGEETVIAYASSTLSRTERNYCTTKRELLAVVKMAAKFRHYLWGRPCTVRTDHGSLRWLVNFKDANGMLARWLMKLNEYDFTIIHRPGAKHLNADALSRKCNNCPREGCKGQYVQNPPVVGPQPEEAESVANEVAGDEKQIESVDTEHQSEFKAEDESEVQEPEMSGFEMLHPVLEAVQTRGQVPRDQAERVKDNEKQIGSVDTEHQSEFKAEDENEVREPEMTGFETLYPALEAVQTRGQVLKDQAEEAEESNPEPTEVENGGPGQNGTATRRPGLGGGPTPGVDDRGLKARLNELKWLTGFSLEDLRKAQEEDPCVGKVLKWREESEMAPDREALATCSDEIKALASRWKRLEVKERLLTVTCLTDGKEAVCTVLPRPLRKVVLYQLHNLKVTGHLGVAKTLKRVKARFYWPGVGADVARWCAKCAVCHKRKGGPPPAKHPMQTMPVGAPFERIALDILDTHKPTSKGYRYILVVADYFTKWTDAFPLKRHTAEKVSELLMNRWVAYYGVPKQIHSDQGKEFEGTVFKALANMLGAAKIRTTPYHAQSDGMVERFNRTILGMLSAFVCEEGTNWDEQLPYVLLAYRSSVHASTGATPYSMLYGREANLPVDLMFPSSKTFEAQEYCGPRYVEWVRRAIASAHDFARQHLEKSAVRQKRGYDVYAKDRVPFVEGDLVRYYHYPTRQANKFGLPWLGPYEVIKKIGPVDYQIRLQSNPRKESIVHVDKLKPYEASPETESDEADEYQGRGLYDYIEETGTTDTEGTTEDESTSTDEDSDMEKRPKRAVKVPVDYRL